MPQRDWNERGNTTLRLSVWFAEVPPGHESKFRSLVSKVIFGRGEDGVAGVRFVAAVCLRVERYRLARAMMMMMMMRELAAALMVDDWY